MSDVDTGRREDPEAALRVAIRAYQGTAYAQWRGLATLDECEERRLAAVAAGDAALAAGVPLSRLDEITREETAGGEDPRPGADR